MKKSEFKALFIEHLKTEGIENPDPKQVDSALGKTARGLIAMHGIADWKDASVGNAYSYFLEYKKDDTYNRIIKRTTK